MSLYPVCFIFHFPNAFSIHFFVCFIFLILESYAFHIKMSAALAGQLDCVRGDLVRGLRYLLAESFARYLGDHGVSGANVAVVGTVLGIR